MGEWDYYCAVCGGPLSVPDTAGYDPNVISPEDPRLRWTANFRVLMSTPDEYGTGKDPWISGPSSVADYGNIEVGFPEDEPIMAGQRTSIQAYEEDEHGGYTVPFHADCLTLFTRYIGADKLDTQVLSDTFRKLGGQDDPQGNNNRCLALVDYGDVAQEAMGQFWFPSEDEEYFVLSPTNIPELQVFFMSMPRLVSDDRVAVQSSSGTQLLVHPDPLSLFPPEILSFVFLLLPPQSFLNLLLASRAACHATSTLGNSFWKSRIQHDMPYLYDLPTGPVTDDEDPVDWRRVCRRMQRASRPISRHVILGLANRRRIWEQILPQLADSYNQELQIRQERRDGGWPSALLGAQSTEMVPLAQPRHTAGMVPMLSDLSQVAQTRGALLVSLDDKRGEICDLSIDSPASSFGRLAATDSLPLPHAIRVERVPVPDNDWPTGFIVTSTVEAALSGAERVHRRRRVVGIRVLFAKGELRQVGLGQGDQCLVHVPPWRFLVGLQTHMSEQGTLCKIDLFHFDESRAGAGSQRVSNCAHAQSYNLEAAKHVWRGQLVPPGRQISNITYYSSITSTKSVSGAEDDDDTDQVLPLESLVFGESEDELSDVTELLADTRFGGFQICYGKRPARAIGPYHRAMKSLKIDGQGGERILLVHTARGSRLDGMRFVTSHNRQLVVGEPGAKSTEQQSGPWAWPSGQYPPLAALYCAWQRRGIAEEAWLGAVGHANTLHFDGGVKFANFPALSLRLDGICWEPVALHESMAGFGPVLGTRRLQHQDQKPRDGPRDDAAGDGEITKDGGVVSWLDSSRALDRVLITLRYDSTGFVMPVISVAFKYGDGDLEEICVGPTIFSPPPAPISEASARAQYVRDVWEVGRRKMRGVRIWTSKSTGIITAIQFVAEDETTSPRWGSLSHVVDETDHCAEIRFQGGGGDAIGLKFCVGYNDDNRTREPVIQTIQGVRRV